MPLVTLVQQSSTGTTALNNTYPSPINKLGNRWVSTDNLLTGNSTGGVRGNSVNNLAYRVDNPSQRLSVTNFQGLQDSGSYLKLMAHGSNQNTGDYQNVGSGYQLYVRKTEAPQIFKWVNGVATRIGTMSISADWANHTLTNVVLDCTDVGMGGNIRTITASVTTGTNNTGSLTVTDYDALPTGPWAGFLMYSTGGNVQTATSLVIETRSVATVPLSIGTRSTSTVTVSTVDSVVVDGHSYAYRVVLTATSTATTVGDKLVTGANSYVITAVTGTTLTVVGDPFSTTAAPSTGSATTLRSFSTPRAWSQAAPSLITKDWIWQGIVFKEGTRPGGEWLLYDHPIVNTLAPSNSGDGSRYFWITAAPGQSFRDNTTAGTALTYNTNTGVSMFMSDSINGEYFPFVDNTNNPYIRITGLQIFKDRGGYVTIFYTSGIYDSCIIQSQGVFAGTHQFYNCVIRSTSNNSLVNESLSSYTQWRNCTLIGSGGPYAFDIGVYPGNTVVRNCAIFGWNTFTSRVTAFNQGLSINNATDLSTLGWTSTGTVVSLTTSSQFNNTAAGSLDFRIREYSSLINNAVRDQQGTGDVDIIGRARSTAAPTIGAWEYLSNRLVTGIQSRDPQTGAVVDMGSYYVSKDYGLDVYPNLVPGRTSPGLYAWGKDGYGELGVGDTINRSSPVQVGALTDWKQVGTVMASLSSAAIKTDGTLWMWGNNLNGQLGLGDTTNRSSPVKVGALTTWKYVSSGIQRTAAIKIDGTMWTWGYSFLGDSLGLGYTSGPVTVTSPVQIGTSNQWKQVHVGGPYTAAAVKTDGTLWTWGLWTGVNSNAPLQVGLLTNWNQVSVGYLHLAAVTTNGTLWTWGDNGQGQLGLGDTTSRTVPVQVGSLNNWKQVVNGSLNSMAIKTDGTLWAWGYNGFGGLGLGNTVNYSSPVQVGSSTNWKQVYVGTYFSLAIKTDGTLWAMGANDQGQLGLGNTVNYSSPVQVGSLTTWKSAATGGQHTIAISDGSI
jgi:alpha-tubulin suppressor-like RCC1 family protein